ncbi:Ubiquitin-conjugating enzyme E2,Ubiquitin-conjugating enzyme/RWD-like,Ubiquitin-conjugating enzyme [Cinara cedri]|uniref:Ubiquitin-conjugating enzyme E2 T n=1 Tax=Cinara cedri TaxID=506608 RepID=A0A5E4MHQ6_9HEMI|nr:Ubiquitin-conjugating enzyme E2,Ubiquitin-conjugating enzyme/RWD-like,Ubiquitin-conjugating enzyme [Cinara cedri]
MFNTPRLKKELSQLIDKPPIGIKVNKKENSLNILEAELNGPKDSPYEDGIFKLIIEVPKKYPFEPPRINFITPVYHPNIDSGGRICLDILKMPPAGAWKPLITIEGVLVAICNLMNCPNPDDPLVPDIARELKTDKDIFEDKAKKFTKMHATMHRTNT